VSELDSKQADAIMVRQLYPTSSLSSEKCSLSSSDRQWQTGIEGPTLLPGELPRPGEENDPPHSSLHTDTCEMQRIRGTKAKTNASSPPCSQKQLKYPIDIGQE